VTFTEGQKEQIKAMVESGDVMGAQKLILKELTSEFGGSAEAIGKTMPKQLNILKESFNNFAGDLVAKAIPSVQRFVDFLNTRLIPAEGFTAKLKVAWEGVTEVSVDLWGRIKAAVEGDERKIRIDTEKKFEVVGETGLAEKIKEKFDAIDFSSIFDTATSESGVATDKLTASIGEKFRAWAIAQPGKIAGDFRASLNANDISADFDRWIMAPLRAAAGNISIPGRQLGTNLVAGVRGGAQALGPLISERMNFVVTSVTETGPRVFSGAVAIGSRIVSGLLSGLADLVGKLRGKLDDIPGIVRSLANPAGAGAVAIGAAIASGVVSGVVGLGARLYSKMAAEVSSAKDRVLGFIGARSPSRMWAEEVGVPIAEGITLGAAHQLNSTLAPNLSSVIKAAMDSTTLGSAAAAGGTGVGFALKGGIDEFLEDKLPDNLAQVLGLAMDQATANFSQAGLGVSWSASPASIGPVGGYSGGPLVSANSTDGASTIVVNNYAPINSQQQLDDMVQSAAARLRNGGRLPI
jgi:hypothetical protein